LSLGIISGVIIASVILSLVFPKKVAREIQTTKVKETKKLASGPGL
jgi:hypothetical protein